MFESKVRPWCKLNKNGHGNTLINDKLKLSLYIFEISLRVVSNVITMLTKFIEIS